MQQQIQNQQNPSTIHITTPSISSVNQTPTTTRLRGTSVDSTHPPTRSLATQTPMKITTTSSFTQTIKEK